MIYTYEKETDGRKFNKELSSWGDALIKTVVVEGVIVTIETYAPLSDDKKIELDALVAAHNPFVPDPQLVVKDKVLRSMAFGQDLIADFAAENVALGFTTEQTLTMAVQFANIQSLLNTGSLKLARLAISQVPASPLVPDERRLRILAKIDKFLDSL